MVVFAVVKDLNGVITPGKNVPLPIPAADLGNIRLDGAERHIKILFVPKQIDIGGDLGLVP